MLTCARTSVSSPRPVLVIFMKTEPEPTMIGESFASCSSMKSSGIPGEQPIHSSAPAISARKRPPLVPPETALRVPGAALPLLLPIFSTHRLQGRFDRLHLAHRLYAPRRAAELLLHHFIFFLRSGHVSGSLIES